MSAITLHYFDGYGRAEPSRMILSHHGTSFTDHRIQFSEWPAIQASGLSEFDELPMLEIDGLKLVESKSIARYLCGKFGYSTANAYDEYLVESICGLREDMVKFFNDFIFKKDMEGYEREMIDSMPWYLKRIEARLVANNNGNGWFVGNKISRADFEIFQCVHDFMLRPSFQGKYERILSEYAPKTRAWMERFKNSSPGFRNYLTSTIA